MAISLETMRAKLLTLDQARTRLGRTEPMTPQAFTVGDAIKFSATSGWNHGVKTKQGSEPVSVFVTLGKGRHGQTYPLTKDALEETCLAFGFPRSYALDCPAELLVPHMNYWFREGLINRPTKKKDFQFLVTNEVATAFTRQSLLPFSNLKLLDQAVAGIREFYRTDDILVDYKFTHSLRQTALRLVVPSASRTLLDTGTDDDTWSIGIQIKNSLTGASQTSLEGYLFRWTCTNGQIDTRCDSGVWTRKPTATEAEVYAWARTAVDEVLGGLESSLDQVQALTQVGIDGSISDTLRDVFEYYRIPIGTRTKIIKYLETYPGEITMYVIMNAITQIANEHGLEASIVDSLMRIGGDLPYSGQDRCGACQRIMHLH